MIKRTVPITMILIIFTGLIVYPNQVIAATDNQIESFAMLDGELSFNADANDYQVWSDTVKSYLSENKDGTLDRIEYCIDTSKLIVENYSLSGKNKNYGKTLQMELELFGGFYSGEKYNFLVFGDTNYQREDSKEIMRVVKYSKDWKRLQYASVFGANTQNPFDAGSLRMAEQDEKLFIHTCHTMYPSTDGLSHQANMTYVINENVMNVLESNVNVSNIYSTGYVSHSFNQFVKTDCDYLYRVDHGDGYPRAIALSKANLSGSIKHVEVALPADYSNIGAMGQNYTGVSVGGFELSDKNCIIAYNAIDFSQADVELTDTRNVYLSITDKSFSTTKIIKLTDYHNDNQIQVSTPQIVDLRNDDFLVLWEELNEEKEEVFTKLLMVNSNGQIDKQGVVSTNYHISDCQPILCSDGYVRWFASMGEKPILYSINPNSLSLSASVSPQKYNYEMNVKLEKGDSFRFPQYSYSRSQSKGASGSSAFMDGLDDDYTVFVANDYCYGDVHFDLTNGRSVIINFDVSKPLNPAPKLKLASNQIDYGVLVEWECDPSAEGYRVLRKTTDGNWVAIADLDSWIYSFWGEQPNYFLDSDVDKGTTYTYTVCEIDVWGECVSTYDAKGVSTTYYNYPCIKKIESTKDGVKLTWDIIYGVDSYRVYYKNSSGEWTRLTTTKNPYFVDTKVTAGNTYCYTLRCLDSNGKFCSDYNPVGWEHTYLPSKLSTPQLHKAEIVSNGVKISWKSVSGAEQYRVFVKKDNSWKTIGDTSDTAFVDSSAEYGKSSVYTVRCISKDSNGHQYYSSDYDPNGISILFAYLGDVNLDRNINSIDRIYYTRHLANWSGYESINPTVADVNSDGEINAQDRMILSRYLAKWKDYSLLPHL